MKMRQCIETDDPESLPGVRKKSFSLPYRNGEIWFEHLDGMYQDADWALEKLITRIASLLCQRQNRFDRVCFIGADKQTKKRLQSALSGKQPFLTAFIDDFECAKAWLIPAGQDE